MTYWSFLSSGIWRWLLWQIGTNISEALAASVFSADVPPKLWYLSTQLHGITSQNMSIFLVTAVKISCAEQRYSTSPFSLNRLRSVVGQGTWWCKGDEEQSWLSLTGSDCFVGQNSANFDLNNRITPKNFCFYFTIQQRNSKVHDYSISIPKVCCSWQHFHAWKKQTS
jgi:hypothetical protein